MFPLWLIWCRYEYIVRATNAAGRTDSPAISVTTDESFPTSVRAPAVSSVTGRYDQLRITWSAPQQPNGLISHYILQRNESTPWNVEVTSQLEYTDDGLMADMIYSYTVSACTSAGCTTSPRSTARTSEHVPASMSPPLMTTLNSSAVRVSWSAPVQANGRITHYQLLMNSTIIYSGLATAQLVSQLQPYVLYEFVISACTSVGCTNSRPALARPDEAPPSDLHAPTVHVTGTRSMEISWLPPEKPNGLITGYELRRNGSLIQLTIDRWYVDYDCLPGTTYGYKVTVYNSKGGVDSPVTFGTTFSSAPQGIRPPGLEALSPTDVAVTWQAPAITNGQIVNYTLYVSHDVVYTGMAVSTVVRGLSPWTEYTFRVAACTLTGCSVSRDSRIRTLEAPPSGLSQPRLNAAVVGQVLVAWAAPQSPNGVITRYELYRRPSNYSDAQGSLFVLLHTKLYSPIVVEKLLWTHGSCFSPNVSFFLPFLSLPNPGGCLDDWYHQTLPYCHHILSSQRGDSFGGDLHVCSSQHAFNAYLQLTVNQNIDPEYWPRVQVSCCSAGWWRSIWTSHLNWSRSQTTSIEWLPSTLVERRVLSGVAYEPLRRFHNASRHPRSSYVRYMMYTSSLTIVSCCWSETPHYHLLTFSFERLPSSLRHCVVIIASYRINYYYNYNTNNNDNNK